MKPLTGDDVDVATRPNDGIDNVAAFSHERATSSWTAADYDLEWCKLPPIQYCDWQRDEDGHFLTKQWLAVLSKIAESNGLGEFRDDTFLDYDPKVRFRIADGTVRKFDTFTEEVFHSLDEVYQWPVIFEIQVPKPKSSGDRARPFDAEGNELPIDSGYAPRTGADRPKIQAPTTAPASADTGDSAGMPVEPEKEPVEPDKDRVHDSGDNARVHSDGARAAVDEEMIAVRHPAQGAEKDRVHDSGDKGRVHSDGAPEAVDENMIAIRHLAHAEDGVAQDDAGGNFLEEGGENVGADDCMDGEVEETF